MSYYILDDNETKGPFTLGQLQSMWHSGAITANTLYCEEGYENWIPLQNLIEKQEHPPPPPAIPQPITAPSATKRQLWTVVRVVILLVVGLIVICGVWMLTYAFKPHVVAKVRIGRESLVIANGNSEMWPRTKIYLNGVPTGPHMQINSEWAPGETKTLELKEFKTLLNNQAFNPEFERVNEVSIFVDRFRNATYSRN